VPTIRNTSTANRPARTFWRSGAIARIIFLVGTTTNTTGANAPAGHNLRSRTQVYGWIAIAGKGLYGRQKDNVAANAQLFTSASVGIMTDAGSAGNPLAILGVFAVALSSGCRRSIRNLW